MALLHGDPGFHFISPKINYRMFIFYKLYQSTSNRVRTETP
jgi:hypothetical protein